MTKHRNENVAATATVLMLLTLGSKLLGFVRELVLAGAFGTSYIIDALVLAQSIPSILLGGVLDAIGTAYTPVYSRIRETEGEAAGNRYTCGILTLSQLAAVAVYLLGLLFAPQITGLLAGGFPPEGQALTVFYLRVTFAYAFFSGSISILDSYLQYQGRFFAPVINNYFFNLGIIGVTLVASVTSHYLLAFGMLLGHALHWLLNLLQAKKSGLHYRPSLLQSSFARSTLHLALPVFVSTSLYSINTFVDKTLAAGLPEGSVSALNYGLMLVSLITGLTGSVVLTILYPRLTQAASLGDHGSYRSMLDCGSSVLVMIALPCTLGIMAFSGEAVQVVFERGAFDGASTVLTASAFFYYGLGMTFLMLSDLLTRVCFTQQDAKTPILCAAISICVNIAADLVLVRVMDHRGLALATSLAALTNTLALTLSIRRKYPHLQALPPLGKLLRITVCAVIAVGVAVGLFRLVLPAWMPLILRLGLAVLSAVAVYLPLLSFFRIEELKLLRELLRKPHR